MASLDFDIERLSRVKQVVRLFYWMVRIAVPITLSGMLAIPLLVAPPLGALSAAKTHSPAATVALVGAGPDQYTFLRLSDPTFLTVRLIAGSAPLVSESRKGMLLWTFFLVALAVLTWRLWRPGECHPIVRPSRSRFAARLRR